MTQTITEREPPPPAGEEVTLEERVARSMDPVLRQRFFEASSRVREALTEAGITEEEILEDFERFRQELRESVAPP